MTERTVTTRLRAEISQYQRDMAAASLSTRAVAKDIDSISGRGPKSASLGLRTLDADARKADSSINQLTGRLRLMADVAAVLGPTLAPIGAVGAAGLAGLATQAGVAVLAGGTLIAVWQGVGDALKAVNQASLEPSVENIAAANEALSGLAPSAREAVMALQAARPVLTDLRNAGAQQYFSGALDGLDSLLSRAPDAERVITAVSAKLGDLTARAGAGLAGDGWDQVFAFAETDMVDNLDDLGASIGNITRGLAELVMAVDPLSDDFSGWMVSSTADFASWADSLSETEGFREFVEYVRSNGPQVGATAGAIADGLLQIVEAASPIGGPVLHGLELAMDVIGAIADSDLGTPIMAGVTALALYNRTLAMTAALSTRMGAGGGLMGTIVGASGATRVKSSLVAARADVEALGASWATAGARTAREQDRMAASAKSLRTNLAAAARTAAPAGAALAGLAVMGTGAADGIGMTNTASLALAGTMFGPWGTAIGAGIGYVTDFAKANTDAAQAAEVMNAAIKDQRITFSSYGDALSAGLKPQAKVLEDLDKQLENTRSHMLKSLTPGGVKQNLDVLFGGVESSAIGKAAAEHEKITKAQEDARFAGAELAKMMGVVDSSFDNTKITTTQMDEALQLARPAMDALGISTDDYISSVSDSRGFESLNAQISNWISAADSASGRSASLTSAFQGLDNSMLSTADSAGAFSAALHGLIDPEVNQEKALLAWKKSLLDLQEGLADGSRAMDRNSKAGIQNRSAITDRVQALLATVDADAAAGASSEELGRKIRNGRKSILDAAEAAGLNRAAVRRMLDEMNLTPEQVKTRFDLTGTDEALGDIESVNRALLSVRDRKVHLSITTTNFVKYAGGGKGRMPAPGKLPGEADGGTVPRTGMGYADRHPYLLADAEEIVSNRDGQADRYRDLLKAINGNATPEVLRGLLGGDATGLASGGTTGKKKPKPRPLSMLLDSADTSTKSKVLGKGKGRYVAQRTDDGEWMPAKFIQSFYRLSEAADAAADATEAQSSRVSDLTSAQAGLISAIQDAYKSDLFAGTSDGWRKPDAGPNATLIKDIEDLTAHKAAQDQLIAKGKQAGLGKDALAEILKAPLESIQGMAAWSPEELAQYSALYGTRAQMAQSTSTAAGEAVYGSEVRAQTAVLERMEKYQSRAEKRLDRLEKKADHFVDRMGKAAAEGTSKTAAKGKKNAQ